MGLRSYQQRVADWVCACFPPSSVTDRTERSHRFLEESLELAQASGCSEEDAIALVRYVYSRPVGKITQETGGVMVTLAALCYAQDVDLEISADRELSRNWDRIDIIRAKQAAKPSGSALPL
ncbi:hypothetical protein [Rhizobium leguminosarum]|uniref:hypothetical protein n=1 Tax=Rhizobium leguminosarum TaxID=384 RepID=UPI00103AE52E|nr:hypothetical protein [Rhizobium leguminosarum]TBY27451.1 hypothetical protein E0H55_27580 [Rhizobium leguminosarum bv. viciae]